MRPVKLIVSPAAPCMITCSLRAGTAFGHMRWLGVVTGVTGLGDAAQVYLARWNYTEVAVKMLHMGENPRQQEEFRRGARWA